MFEVVIGFFKYIKKGLTKGDKRELAYANILLSVFFAMFSYIVYQVCLSQNSELMLDKPIPLFQSILYIGLSLTSAISCFALIRAFSLFRDI